MKLKIEVTHLCNRNCKWCANRINTSNFNYLTEENYYKIIKCMTDCEIDEIKLTGGEPLCHPFIKWLILRLKQDFPNIPLILQTNGDLLEDLTPYFLDCFKRIEISKYDNPSNQAIIDKYGDRYNVLINDCTEFDNIYVNPNLNSKTAMKAHKICVHAYPRFVGTKVYGCCVAEPIEREHNLKSIHFEVTPDWQDRYKELKTWLACQHCHHATKMANWKVRMGHRINKIIRDNKFLFNVFKIFNKNR